MIILSVLLAAYTAVFFLLHRDAIIDAAATQTFKFASAVQRVSPRLTRVIARVAARLNHIQSIRAAREINLWQRAAHKAIQQQLQRADGARDRRRELDALCKSGS